jgi:diphthamide biosynthesis protein 3
MVAYEEVALDDMVWNDEVQAYTYECPCGDLFQISLAELRAGESIARCPSCSLYLQVTYDPVRGTHRPWSALLSQPRELARR